MAKKAYWITHVDITEPVGYKAFADANGAAFKKYGARFLARGQPNTMLEGSGRARNAIIEFPSLQAALDCHASPEYQYAKSLREGACHADVMVVEGYEEPIPA